MNLFQISQIQTWKEALKEADSNKDGKLSFLEFQDAVKFAEKKMAEKKQNEGANQFFLDKETMIIMIIIKRNVIFLENLVLKGITDSIK